MSVVLRQNCVYWSSENLNAHIDKTVNVPLLSISCGVLSRMLWDGSSLL